MAINSTFSWKIIISSPTANFLCIFLKVSKFQCWHFEVSEDIITKFKSQGVYIIRIKYRNASVSGFPPSFPPSENIDILHYKQAKLPKHLQHSVYNIRMSTMKPKLV